MARYLMTHSLLSSWLYAMKENPYEDASTERDPYAEFLQVLRREPTPTTEAMQKGIDFEDLVTDIVNGVGDTQNRWYDAAQKVAGYVRGGILQYKARRIITSRLATSRTSNSPAATTGASISAAPSTPPTSRLSRRPSLSPTW